MKQGLITMACVLLLPGASLAGASASPSTTKVVTSRGDQYLLVYRPDVAPTDNGKPLVLFISGEGGWRRFDGMLAKWIADAGYVVGGVNAMEYFWEPQDDRTLLASDFRAYGTALAASAGRPGDTPLVLAGFSFGADLAPWLAGAGGWGKRLAGMLMLAPDKEGSLAFRVLEILGFDQDEHVFSVEEALRSAAGIPVFFIHGEKDSGADTPALAKGAAQPSRLITITGADHHFSGRETELRGALVEGLEWIESPSGTAPK